jgi:hypothetical protein
MIEHLVTNRNLLFQVRNDPKPRKYFFAAWLIVTDAVHFGRQSSLLRSLFSDESLKVWRLAELGELAVGGDHFQIDESLIQRST